MEKLIKIIAQLRSPQKGCPWDLEQTNISLIPYLLEEAHEAADAIRYGDDEDLKEELGDVLLQILLHAQIAKEEERFTLEDIVNKLSDKLIKRHPHVFGNKTALSSEEAKRNWELMKSSEKKLQKSHSTLSETLKEKIRSQPALAAAMEISQKTAQAGFDWDNIDGVWNKVSEELEELKIALKKNNYSHAQEELGDLLFTLVNIARWCKLNPEEGLAETNHKFLNRFSYVEENAKVNLSHLSKDKLQQLWQSAKKHIAKGTL